MRSMALTAAVAAILVSLPLSMASAGGRDRDRGNDHGGGGHHDSDRGGKGDRGDHGKDRGHHDKGHGHKEKFRDHLAIAGSKALTDGDATNSYSLSYGQTPPTCSPYVTTWNCIPPRGYPGYR